MNKTESDLVVFGYKCINEKGKIITKKEYSNKSFSGDHIRSNYLNFVDMASEFGIQGGPWNKFFKMNKIREKNIKYPPLKRHQDEVFIARYVEHAEKVCFIENILYTYLTNDISKEWEKYPINYSDIVEELRKHKTEIIGKWNPENKEIQNNINIQYIHNYIKSIELSYNKKFKFNKKQHMRWFIEKTSSDDFFKIVNITELPSNMGYQKMFISFARKKKYLCLYFLLKIKVLINFRMHGLLVILKRLKRVNMKLVEMKKVN
jgi:hypothetical protein